MKLIKVLFLLLILLGIWSCSLNSEPAFLDKKMAMAIHFQDSFSLEEQKKLTGWITQVGNATASTLGAYPFITQVYFKRSTSDRSAGPVPWAYTKRSPQQCVYFHVNTAFTLQELLADWTAPHELSHLSIPFVGKSNSWYAEGYASFMQYQVMQSLGVLSADEVTAKYQEKFNMHLPYFVGYENNIGQRAMQLRAQHNYPAMYWGGAYYFHQEDSIYRSQNSSFTQLIREYQKYRPKTTYQKIEQIEQLWETIADSLMIAN